jgi:hypothetical protein
MHPQSFFPYCPYHHHHHHHHHPYIFGPNGAIIREKTITRGKKKMYTPFVSSLENAACAFVKYQQVNLLALEFYI